MPDPKEDQKTMALAAAERAESVLGLFAEKYPRDERPQKAVEAARAWAGGEIGVAEAREAAFAAHAAARSAETDAARYAARAAGHAAAVAHVAAHARHAEAYALKAMAAAGKCSTDTEK